MSKEAEEAGASTSGASGIVYKQVRAAASPSRAPRLRHSRAARRRHRPAAPQFRDERDLPTVMALIDGELSEPYSIFTYRYFVRQWPQLTWIAYASDPGDADPDPGGGPAAAAAEAVGVIVAKADAHRGGPVRGYIAMLTVSPAARGAGVGSELVRRCVGACAAAGCREVALEAEATNAGALRLYGQLGFLRDKRLQRYYLNGNDAYRLKLRLPPPAGGEGEGEAAPERAAASEAVAEEALRSLSLERPEAPGVGA